MEPEIPTDKGLHQVRLKAAELLALLNVQNSTVDKPHIVRIHEPVCAPTFQVFWGPYPNALSALEASERILEYYEPGRPPARRMYSASVHPLRQESECS
jgi:hypothetical protein